MTVMRHKHAYAQHKLCCDNVWEVKVPVARIIAYFYSIIIQYHADTKHQGDFLSIQNFSHVFYGSVKVMLILTCGTPIPCCPEGTLVGS